MMPDGECTRTTSVAGDSRSDFTGLKCGDRSSPCSGDGVSLALDPSEVVGDDRDDAPGSGRKARFFHDLLLLYRRVFSRRFLRLCSDITWERIRFNVASREPPLTDCGSEFTQKSVERPPPALRGSPALDSGAPFSSAWRMLDQHSAIAHDGQAFSAQLTGVGWRCWRRGSKRWEDLLVVMLRVGREVVGGRLGIHLIETA
jgi:hypothetical protein